MCNELFNELFSDNIKICQLPRNLHRLMHETPAVLSFVTYASENAIVDSTLLAQKMPACSTNSSGQVYTNRAYIMS